MKEINLEEINLEEIHMKEMDQWWPFILQLDPTPSLPLSHA